MAEPTEHAREVNKAVAVGGIAGLAVVGVLILVAGGGLIGLLPLLASAILLGLLFTGRLDG